MVRSIDLLPLRGATTTRARALLAVLAALLVASCATIAPYEPVKPTAPPLPRNAEPPPPRVNLSGFPLAYRQGYADGCASAKGAERKDAGPFGKDGSYSMGWQDGIALCTKR